MHTEWFWDMQISTFIVLAVIAWIMTVFLRLSR